MATKPLTAEEKRAGDALAENLGKSFEKKVAARKKSADKWRGRGTSGEAEEKKEFDASQDVETKEDRKSFDGLYIDMENARKYGRDAYKSRAFGKPKTVGKLKRGGKVDGYKKGGKIDGIAMKGKTKGRMC